MNQIAEEETRQAKLYSFPVTDIQGKARELAEFRGQVILIVNTASKCGLTPQFEGLEALYQKYRDQGFVVLGFPCNQFLSQDPGSNEEIAAFCQKNYGVSFPMFARIEVNGSGTHPLYQFLKKQKKGALGSEAIKWNFTKFLVSRDGEVIARYAPTDEPAGLAGDIEEQLARTN